MRGSESAPPVADEADEERAVSPGLKSLKRVWNRSLPPPVAEAGRRRLGIARSALAQLCGFPGSAAQRSSYGVAIPAKQSGSEALPDGESAIAQFELRVVLLCKSFCKASDSTARRQDLHHLVGNATGIMPVWRNFAPAGMDFRGPIWYHDDLYSAAWAAGSGALTDEQSCLWRGGRAASARE